jgi:hypothetical protein
MTRYKREIAVAAEEQQAAAAAGAPAPNQLSRVRQCCAGVGWLPEKNMCRPCPACLTCLH